MAAGLQAWHSPNHVGMQNPEVCPSRLAHASPTSALHWSLVVQAVRLDWPWMPVARLAASSTPVTPKALAYLVAGESVPAPSQRLLSPSWYTGQ